MDRLLETPGFDVTAILAEARRLMNTEAVLERGGGFIDMRREGDPAAAAAVIPDALVAELAAIGPLESVRAKLDRLHSAGITEIVIMRPDLPDPAEWAALLTSLRV